MYNAFELNGVIKKYKDFTLGPLELNLSKGTVMGYVGNNGAGKTTTILMLAGILMPDKGNISVCGIPINNSNIDWKFRTAFVGEAGGYYESWSVSRNLKFISEFFPNWDFGYMDELIKRFSLDTNKKVAELSTGNRMKLKLVTALSYKPELLLLDEPSSGLDPLVRAEFSDILREYMENEENSILYSTHIISDLNRLADELTYLSDGEIILTSNCEDLNEKWKKIVIKSEENIDIHNKINLEKQGSLMIITSNDYSKTINELSEKSIEVESIIQMNLEEITLEILKRG